MYDLATEARSHLKAFHRVLASKGYDRVLVRSLTVGTDDVSVSYQAIDDFQADLPSEYQVHHGFYLSFYEPSIDEIYTAIRRLPSREMRELQVLARQTSAIGKHLEDLQSAQARAFSQALMDEAASLHNAIEDLRG